MNSEWHEFEKLYPLEMSSLRMAKSGGRLSHAYLLCSSNSSYRLDFPPLLAALAICENPEPDFSPCGHCGNCRSLARGVYPDFYTLEPTSKSRRILVGKDEDDPDTMRWFEAIFHLRGMTKCGWKIGVIQDADCLDDEAQNAFLKTLEEPPEKCLFILTTANAATLLPTIRSRCQPLNLVDNHCVYDFPGAEKLPGILEDLAFRSRNSLLQANQNADSLLEIKLSLIDAAKQAASEKWAKRLEYAENLGASEKKNAEKRAEAEENGIYRKMRAEFISMLHAFFAQIEMLKCGIPYENLPNPEALPKNLDISQIDSQTAHKMLDYAVDLTSAMKTNADDELAIRTFCLRTAFK